MVRWRESDETDIDIVLASDANLKCPQVVIKFYEKRLIFNENSSSSSGSSDSEEDSEVESSGPKEGPKICEDPGASDGANKNMVSTSAGGSGPLLHDHSDLKVSLSIFWKRSDQFSK